MFLTLKEMSYEKVRYSLIVIVISLISFLIFILSALALGLANGIIKTVTITYFVELNIGSQKYGITT